MRTVLSCIFLFSKIISTEDLDKKFGAVSKKDVILLKAIWFASPFILFIEVWKIVPLGE